MHMKGDLAVSAGWLECILQAVKDKEAFCEEVVSESRPEGAVTGRPGAAHSRQGTGRTKALEGLLRGTEREELSWGSSG